MPETAEQVAVMTTEAVVSTDTLAREVSVQLRGSEQGNDVTA